MPGKLEQGWRGWGEPVEEKPEAEPMEAEPLCSQFPLRYTFCEDQSQREAEETKCVTKANLFPAPSPPAFGFQAKSPTTKILWGSLPYVARIKAVIKHKMVFPFDLIMKFWITSLKLYGCDFCWCPKHVSTSFLIQLCFRVLIVGLIVFVIH